MRLSTRKRLNQMGKERPSGYDIAEICRRGHVITMYAATRPEKRAKYCDKCGASTLDKCENCETQIRGYFHRRNVSGGALTKPPRFCHECGTPYPWTAEGLVATKEYVEELDDLPKSERRLLVQSLDDIVRDTPSSSLAVHRVKKAAAKLKKPTAEVFSKMIIEIATETVKKLFTS